MTKLYNPQEDREVAERLIELTLNYHKYGTSYPTPEQIANYKEKSTSTQAEPSPPEENG